MGGNYPSGGLLGMGDIMTGAPGGAGAAAGQPAGDPATDPALGAAASPYILNGAPLVQPPDMSKALMAAAQGVFAANQAGQGLSGWMAGGLGGYSQNLELQRQRSNDQRRQQLSDMALMQEIETRQMTKAAMTNKVRALQRLKTLNPTLADQIDIDPEGVSAAMTAAMTPKYEKMGLGDKMVKMQDGKATIVADPMADEMGGTTAPATVTNADGTTSPAPADPNAGIPKMYQGVVDDMLNGNPPQRLLSNPQIGPLLIMWAQQKDPEFNTTQMNTRKETADDFSSAGKSGQTLTSVAAAAGQLAKAKEYFDQMHELDGKGGNFLTNEGSKLMNSTTLGNWINNEVSGTYDNPRGKALGQFMNKIGIAAPDLAKVATGSSSPAQAEIETQMTPFSAAKTKDNMHGVFQSSAETLHQKAQDLLNTYQRQFKGKLPPGLALFTPETVADFKSLGVDISDLMPKVPAATPASAGSGQPSPQAVATPQSAVDQVAKVIDAATTKSGQAAAGNAITAPGAPGLKLPATLPVPPVPGAKLAPDGNWYVPDPARPGKFLMVK